MTDFYKMSAMMKDLFPSTPEQDKQALLNMANNDINLVNNITRRIYNDRSKGNTN